MKGLSLLAVFAAALVFGTINNGNAIGIGFMVGEPTGLSIRVGQFPILGIAWSFRNYLHIHLDGWLYNGKLAGPLTWFIGIGGKVRLFNIDNKTSEGTILGLGFRVPIGIDWFIIKPAELFLEVAPGIAILPATGFDWDAALGLRFHF